MTSQTLAPPQGLYADDMATRELRGIQDARDNFRERVDRALENGVHTVVTRHGRAAVAVVPWSWYLQAAEAMEDPVDLEMLTAKPPKGDDSAAS